MPNWGTALGNITNWLNPFLNERSRLKRQISAKEKEIEELGKQLPTPQNSARRVDLERSRNELRMRLENLKD